MRRHGSAWKSLALSLTLAASTGVANAQQLGTATVAGPVRVDGQAASGSVSVNNATRIATGDGSTATLALGGGGEVRMAGLADAIVTMGSTGPVVQLICGQVTVTGAGVRVYSRDGARVETTTGRVNVLFGADDRKTVKDGDARNFDDPVVVEFTEPGTSAVVISRAQCGCNCP